MQLLGCSLLSQKPEKCPQLRLGKSEVAKLPWPSKLPRVSEPSCQPVPWTLPAGRALRSAGGSRPTTCCKGGTFPTAYPCLEAYPKPRRSAARVGSVQSTAASRGRGPLQGALRGRLATERHPPQPCVSAPRLRARQRWRSVLQLGAGVPRVPSAKGKRQPLPCACVQRLRARQQSCSVRHFCQASAHHGSH